MAIQIVPFRPEHEPAAAEFNARMRAAEARSDFLLPLRAPAEVPEGIVRDVQYVAVDDSRAVRGGVILREHPGWVGGRLEHVVNLQSPVSEGIIDPRFTLLATQLVKTALKRSPFAYVVGMGSETNPLPRVLKAMGWSVRKVPFSFQLLRVARCLGQIAPLRTTPVRRLVADAARLTGAGWVGARVLQHPRGTRALEVARSRSDDAAVDEAWRALRERSSFAVVRDRSTLPLLLGRGDGDIFVARAGGAVAGWFDLVLTQMRGSPYFGDLRVATLADAVPMPGHEASLLAAAARQARTLGADIVCTNLSAAWLQAHARRAGWLSGPSNYLVATSKALSAELDDSAYITRRDGDGLTNLTARG